MINRYSAERSINQLICIILGRRQAQASAHFAYSPSERIKFCQQLIGQQREQARKAKHLAALSACDRQLCSLDSLETLAQLLNEVKW
jgi:hypothetical protein